MRSGHEIFDVASAMRTGFRTGVAGILLLVISGDLPADELVTLDTRPGVMQSFLLLEPPGEVQGVVILFPGHEGVVRFVNTGPGGYRLEHEGGGFTVREETRETYRRNGLAVALVAPPSDRADGMDTAFRSSGEHLEDVRRIIHYLKDRFGQNPYLHGHCRSSLSPASITTGLENEGIAGMILSSARSRGRHGAVMDYRSGVISVPVLLVQHREDPCKGTPYSNLNRVKDFYEQSSGKVDVMRITGGDTAPRGTRPCQGGAHSFRGLEEKTAEAITAWILGKQFDADIE